METQVQINLWAVLVSAIVYFLIGGLWYSPLMFEKSWLKAIGKKESQLDKSGMGKTMTLMFLLGLVFLARSRASSSRSTQGIRWPAFWLLR